MSNCPKCNNGAQCSVTHYPNCPCKYCSEDRVECEKKQHCVIKGGKPPAMKEMIKREPTEAEQLLLRVYEQMTDFNIQFDSLVLDCDIREYLEREKLI